MAELRRAISKVWGPEMPEIAEALALMGRLA